MCDQHLQQGPLARPDHAATQFMRQVEGLGSADRFPACTWSSGKNAVAETTERFFCGITCQSRTAPLKDAREGCGRSGVWGAENINL